MTPRVGTDQMTAFQEDIAYSTFSGYYAIRLIDNITDRDGPKELPALLPTAGYFHWRFLQPYIRYFPDGHAFWPEFHRVWSDQAELHGRRRACARYHAGCRSTGLGPEVRRDQGARGGGGLPLRSSDAAGIVVRICRCARRRSCSSGTTSSIGSTMPNHGINTLAAERIPPAARRAGKRTSRWFLREGFAWGSDRLRIEMRKVAERGRRLDNDDVTHWIDVREQLLDQQLSEATANPIATGEGSSSLGERASAH